ncbi:MAG: response regulator [Iodobacter sp.]
MTDKIKIMLLDDHEVVRAGLMVHLKDLDDIRILGSFSRVADLLAALRQQQPDVLLLDYVLGKDEVDGINLIQSLRAKYPECPVLVVSSMDMSAVSVLLSRAGVSGFVGKSQPLDQLVKAIRLTAYGYSYWPDNINKSKSVANESGTADLASMLDVLSPREREVLRCYLDGMTVSEIAHKFSRSVKTISTQKQTALQKLGISSDRDLFRLNV